MSSEDPDGGVESTVVHPVVLQPHGGNTPPAVDRNQLVGASRSVADAGTDGDAGRCDVAMTIPPSGSELDPIEGFLPDRNWWVVTSAGRLDSSVATFVPMNSPPAAVPTSAEGRTFLALNGTGLRQLDYGLLAFSARPSLNGGEPVDLGNYTGITFDAKGTHVWIEIRTVDVVERFCRCSEKDCLTGYRFQLPVTTSWATYTVTWDQLQLPAYVNGRPPFDPRNVISISFGGFDEDFDVSVDNLRLAPDEQGDGGEDR